MVRKRYTLFLWQRRMFKITDGVWLGQHYTAHYTPITKSDFIAKAYGFGVGTKFRYQF